MINAQRNAQGAASLIWHDGLAAAANSHAQEMADDNYLSLISPAGYDIFQSLVSLSPAITFDDAFALVYQHPAGAGAAATFAILMSVPDVAAALMDPTMTHYALRTHAGTAQPTLGFAALIVAKKVAP
jgi:uncharacterized protein YkwD